MFFVELLQVVAASVTLGLLVTFHLWLFGVLSDLWTRGHRSRRLTDKVRWDAADEEWRAMRLTRQPFDLREPGDDLNGYDETRFPG